MRVLTIGTFDLFHAGHVNFLQQCSMLGEVTVGVNRDGFVKRFKGKGPICTLEERLAVVRGCRWVSRAVANEYDEEAWKMMEDFNPSVLAIGTDWHMKDYMRQIGTDITYLTRQGVMLAYVPYTAGVTSTELRERVVADVRGGAA